MSNDFEMQYIMDGNGNYYMVNGDDQLVVAKGKEEAGVFSFSEANQRIGKGKKAKFYLTIPVGDIEETEKEMLKAAKTPDDPAPMNSPAPAFTKVLSMVDRVKEPDETDDSKENTVALAKEKPTMEYCMENTDWEEFANYYLFLATNIFEYQNELAKQQSDVEKELCDLLHYVELYNLTEEEELRTMAMLKEVRIRRRDIKDERLRSEFFQKMMGTSANVVKIKGFLTELKKLKTRKYRPRQLPDLFDGMEGKKTDMNAYRERLREQEIYEVDEKSDTDAEEQEMSFAETIYDHRENDWLGFAKQQLEFYENAEQYMMNLRIEIDEIDQSMELMLENIEDANYNVAQGYKVFRELKDLRNQRKAKEKELAILRTMTECFDLKAMADTFAYNVTELEKMM